MKSFRILIMVLFTCSAAFPVGAEDFYAEEPLTPITPNGIESIKKYETLKGNLFDCDLYGKPIDLAGTGKTTDWIVTTRNACQWAASAAPVWVLKRDGDKYAVVLKFVTFNLEVMKTKSNGLHNITAVP